MYKKKKNKKEEQGERRKKDGGLFVQAVPHNDGLALTLVTCSCTANDCPGKYEPGVIRPVTVAEGGGRSARKGVEDRERKDGRIKRRVTHPVEDGEFGEAGTAKDKRRIHIFMYSYARYTSGDISLPRK